MGERMLLIGGSSHRWLARAAALALSACLVAGCQSQASSTHEELAPDDDAPIFSSSIFGVKASPRVTRLKRVPKGGGRDQTGQPYKVRGKWYYPKEEPGYVKTGQASWYGANFHGRLTANGEVYDMYHLSAAHPTFPLPSYARITNRKTGASVMVRVNDRGPYMHDRVMDVSSKAAELLGFQRDGIADVKVEYVGRAPLEGDDTKILMASYRPGESRPIDDGLPTGVMIASNRPAHAATTLVATAFAPPKPVSPRATAPAPAAMSVEDLIRTYDAPTSTPVPSSRGLVLSYAPAGEPRGSRAAVLDIMREPRSVRAPEGERIEVGLVDRSTRLRLSKLIALSGLELLDEGEGSLAIQMPDGVNADELLTKVWHAGAGSAFVLHD
ncbi:rare lipoprotein A [Aureimonas jatrophae]|uniref:Endolytic peptidoglycan transglycosylase RlpA n=1 Tax=Aureimonas jatrophae TaxID=1166073 RepID=A0A1H0GZ90_9HYPH|nr:septal ring lytic transglycosylase RlpA family protein [Aureimonas jatrophae]SDO12203.1 rare lipoprotein A [Aureimonas jatrophae]